MINEINNLFISLVDTYSELDEIYKRTSCKLLDDYSYTEMHCIDAIGRIKNPNVTKISTKINMTKGGISKIIKRLLKKNAISSFSNPENKKEIYFKLEENGKIVFREHEKLHKKWNLEQNTFSSQFSGKELKIIQNFLFKYNNFLKEKLNTIKENK